MAEGWPKERKLLGTKIKRLDGPEKSTGRAKYSYDINRPGMLHAAMLRCPHAHAKVKSIDTSAAKKTPGFKSIVLINASRDGRVLSIDGDKLTYAVGKGKKEEKFTVPVSPTVTLIKQNKIVALKELKADDLVTVEAEQDLVGQEYFYAGDEVLAIAADTEEHAHDAIRAVKVEYEVLEHYVTEADVLKDKDKKTTPGPRPSNFSDAGSRNEGDIEAGFKEADAVSEGTYGVPVISHQCLEAHGLVAEWDKDGGVTIWASTQATVNTASGVARRFAIPPTQVKCITHYMGGGFGSKFGPDVQGLAAVDLSRRAGGAAVKLMLDREGEITSAGNRPSAIGKVKIGGKKDGTLTAFEVDCYGTPGYTGGSTVNLNLLPYVYGDALKNFSRKHSVLYTNAGGARAMRAPGHPQNCVLTEFAVDDLAAKLGIDPLVIRRKNLPPNDENLKKKNPVAWLARRNDVYNQQLDIAAKLADWQARWHPPGKGKGGTVKHGIGMAIHTWGGFASGQLNDCEVIISHDGTVTAESSTQDLGTGQRTVTAIVAAEILGLQPTDILVKIGESQYGPSSGSGGSTTCPSQAPSALLAAQTARDDLFKKVAPKVNADPKDLQIQAGKVVDGKNKKEWAWKEFCARLGMDQARGKGEWNQAASFEPGNENISSGQVGGVQIAEVQVDTETGVVRITHIVAVQDCGLIVNKQGCESQVAGGVIMGLNYALFEENILDRITGRQVNPDMEFYKLGGLRDMPKITVHMVDMPDRGVIGIGEPPTISTAAAVGNAVFNAIGVRVPMLPLTPKHVLDALGKGGKA